MPRLIDTTLREGEQTPGLHLCLTAKKRLFAGLTKTGVDEIELGMASAANPDLAELVSFADTHFPLQPFSLWCRCRKEDIRLAASLRPSVLALSIPTSDLHLKKKLKRDRAWASAQVATSIRLALALGVPKVALGLEDASRADHGFLVEITEIARGAGAFRIRIADTVGIADPAMIACWQRSGGGSALPQ
jgi:homocitrate synthase NifV